MNRQSILTITLIFALIGASIAQAQPSNLRSSDGEAFLALETETQVEALSESESGHASVEGLNMDEGAEGDGLLVLEEESEEVRELKKKYKGGDYNYGYQSYTPQPSIYVPYYPPTPKYYYIDVDYDNHAHNYDTEIDYIHAHIDIDDDDDHYHHHIGYPEFHYPIPGNSKGGYHGKEVKGGQPWHPVVYPY